MALCLLLAILPNAKMKNHFHQSPSYVLASTAQYATNLKWKGHAGDPLEYVVHFFPAILLLASWPSTCAVLFTLDISRNSELDLNVQSTRNV